MTTTATTETLLLGPGPSNVPMAVRDTLSQPVLGHLDPRFLGILETCKQQLRSLLRTDNTVTLPVSGTGSAGMEACLVNILEPGDTIVVGQNGVFGMRLGNLAERLGAKAVRVEQEWGRAMQLDALAAAAREHKPKIIAVVNGETSTGVYQPMHGLAELACETGALLLADCVTSLAGAPVLIDDWGVDLVYSGTQKCLNVPPGLAPVSFSERAIASFEARQAPVPSFYLDLGEILKYVGDGQAKRAYHHTAPVGMIAALNTGLELILNEGLAARWQRHVEVSAYLIERVASLGLEPLVPAAERLAPLTTLKIPAGVDEAAVRARLLNDDNIELGAGLGPLAGTVWRVGLMGINAQRDIVDHFVDRLGAAMQACR
ncbi:MAG: pyridoxal-phosphate-dependent aminotransferase family protein [Planctomycetota bacterium]